MVNGQRVVISILNWNSAQDTLNCIRSVLASSLDSKDKMHIYVLDNGSDMEDYGILKDGIDHSRVEMIRMEENIGFAAGHNVIIKRAIEMQANYVWLLNNDTITQSNVLMRLMGEMNEYPRCGVISPVIVRMGNTEIVDSCGAMHHWKSFSSITPPFAEAKRLQEEIPEKIWLIGTAIMIRVDAIKEIGLLDERYFAYYEDDDIGVRFSQKGWLSRVAFDCMVEHECFNGVITDRKPYYFYLMARNSFIFFLKHTPREYRKLILLRLINRSLFVAEDLKQKGFTDKANACLLGIADGISRRYGKPNLERSVPFWIQLLRPIAGIWNKRKSRN